MVSAPVVNEMSTIDKLFEQPKELMSYRAGVGKVLELTKHFETVTLETQYFEVGDS